MSNARTVTLTQVCLYGVVYLPSMQAKSINM